MTKIELKKILSANDFNDTSIFIENKNINVIIYKTNGGYSAVIYDICNPSGSLIKEQYETIKQMLESWLFTTLFKKTRK